MKPSEIFNQNISNRDKFGFYVKARRAELGFTVRGLAKALNLTPAYISDIENGNRTAPLKHLKQLAKILKIEESELNYFYDIAGCSHSNWPDINEYLAKVPTARKAVRLARDINMPEEQFMSMVLNMIEEKSQTEQEQLEIQ